MISNSDVYKSISAPSEGLFKDQGSRFIALAYPVESEAEVKALLEAAGWQDVQRILDAEGRDRGAAARNG